MLSNSPIDVNENKIQGWPFLRLAFRPFFWLGALFSIVSVSVWALSFTGKIAFNPFGGSYFWHTHEMLFGFMAAIIVGFLLTAVQTWTRVPSIKGKSLGLLVVVWLSARILLAFPSSMPSYWIIAVDLLFLPLAAGFFSVPIIKARMWRNLIFTPILLLMAVLNGLIHAAATGAVQLSFIQISHVVVLLVSLVMCIIGGRVFPMFTANGTGTKRIPPIAWLEKLSIFSVAACVFAELGRFFLPAEMSGGLFFLAGTANLIRALRWRIWVTLKTPLVWPLHVSYWSICVGLIMLGLVKLQWFTGVSLAYHTITVGGAGLMILAMISRVSLGHTGRAIHVGKIMNTSFILMFAAFLSRVFAPLFISQYMTIILLTAGLWVLAYGAFVIIYCPVLFQPRVDGADG